MSKTNLDGHSESANSGEQKSPPKYEAAEVGDRSCSQPLNPEDCRVESNGKKVKCGLSHLNAEIAKEAAVEEPLGNVAGPKDASFQNAAAEVMEAETAGGKSPMTSNGADSSSGKSENSESKTDESGFNKDAESSRCVKKLRLDIQNQVQTNLSDADDEGSIIADKGPLVREVLRSPVVEFYNGRSIFITGATGFMGKVLVQRLLQNCPGIDKIYLLIRPKRDSLPEERLSSLLRVAIFDEVVVSSLEKVVAIQGDITEPALGISKEDEEKLINSVSVIFHSAATVKFDDDLTKSVQMNIGGTQMILDLARKMPHLKALVHTSTAFSHCYTQDVSEKFYPCPSSTPEAMMKLCNGSGSNTEAFQKALNHPLVTKEVIGQHPNTYTFTKALAEQLLIESGADLPLAIVRPSIVVASWKHPLPGWVDNLNGPTGMITGASSGILRSIMVTPGNVADIIPVDVAINLMCVVASRLGNSSIINNNNKSVIPIYNCTSGSINPITWKGIKDKIIPGITKYPLEQMVWFPTLIYQTNPWIHWVSHLMLHRMPAFIIDAGLKLFGQQPFLGRVISRLEKATEALEFFSTRQWTWDSTNIEELEKSMEPADRAIFGIDIKGLDWDSYMVNYAYGARHYVMKGDPSTVEASVRKGKFLLRAHQALVFLLTLGLLTLLGTLLDPFDLSGKFFFSCVFSLLFTLWVIDCRFE